LQLNLGLWKKGTKNLSQALLNLNQEMAEKAELTAESIVLDAGCGIGGTAIYFAKHYGCKVIGITLAPHQAEKARENATKAGVDKLCTFEVMNFMKTSFDDGSFNVVVGIESICYAEPKIVFIKEAYRLLKKGGKLVVADNLQGKAELSEKEFKYLYTNSFYGCKVTSLDTKEEYLKNLETADFTEYSCEDCTDLIRPSILRLRRIYYLAATYNTVHRLLRKPFSATQEANTRMCYHLQSSLKKGLWKYGIIRAFK
jgi:tocopherol O-methyltransferase